MRRRVDVLVVKRGERGALGIVGEEVLISPAPQATVVDTTGAGDTFGAGFLAGWLRGMHLQICLDLGTYCGSQTTTQLGGFSGQPTWEEASRALGIG